MQKPPALIFNCYFNGLSIIQALGRKGVKAYALDDIREVGTYSRYATFWRCPNPLANEDDFINFLLDRGPIFASRAVLFPTNDHWATALSKHKVRLQQYYIPCVAEWGTVELLVSKDRFYPWALERGYPVPKLYQREELLSSDFTAFPVIAKPKYIRMSGLPHWMELSARLDRGRMVLLRNRDELNSYLAENQDILPYLIFQEYVPGMADRMYTVGIYANKDHEVLGVFTGRKVRGFPPDIGDCVVGQAEKLAAEMITLVKRMVADLRFHGIDEFEFKRNLENNEFKLIEVNPRSWSWIGITPACGVNLPWMAYADLTGVETVDYRESDVDYGEIKYVRLISDFENCLFANKMAGFPEYHMGPKQWWKSLRAKKVVWAEFSRDEPRLGLIILVKCGWAFIAALVSKIVVAIFRREKGKDTAGIVVR